MPRRERVALAIYGHDAAIRQRLGDVDSLHALAAVHIGQSPSNAKDTVIAARREPQALGRLRKQLAAGRVGRRDLFQEIAIGLGIGRNRPRGRSAASGGAVTGKLGVARALDRAHATRAATAAEFSRAGGSERSAGETAGTSTWRSMRSNSGPEMRDWYSRAHLGARPQPSAASSRWPQRHGFIAATSMKRAGYVM